jgi:hypothetical protein
MDTAQGDSPGALKALPYPLNNPHSLHSGS